MICIIELLLTSSYQTGLAPCICISQTQQGPLIAHIPTGTRLSLPSAGVSQDSECVHVERKEVLCAVHKCIPYCNRQAQWRLCGGVASMNWLWRPFPTELVQAVKDVETSIVYAGLPFTS
jgi:hypothetical protein